MEATAQGVGGVYQQPVVKQPVTKFWWMSFTFLHVALLTPYATKLVTHYYGEGIFPIRPLFYMIGLGGLSLIWVAGKRPDFTKTGILLFILLAMRVIDAGLLQRFLLPGGNHQMFLGLGAAFFMGIVLFSSVGVLHKMSYKPIQIVSISTIAVVVASIIYEYLGFGDYTNVLGRPSGHIGDPNNACIVMTLMLGVFLSVTKKFWHNIGAIALTTIGVFPTLSRGGMMVLVMIIMVFVLMNLNKYFVRFLLIGIAAVPLVATAVGLLIAKAQQDGKGGENALSRIEAIFRMDVNKMGSSDRMQDFNAAVMAVQKNPLTGLGTGAGTEWYQPHNQFLSLWVDIGIVGAFLYAGVLGLLVFKSIVSGFKAIYAVVPIILFVPLSQALIDNFAYLYAIAVVLILTSRRFWSIRLMRPKNV